MSSPKSSKLCIFDIAETSELTIRSFTNFLKKSGKQLTILQNIFYWKEFGFTLYQ